MATAWDQRALARDVARLGYLGPAGTFSEEAAATYAPSAQLVPLSSFAAAVEAVAAGQLDAALVPVENSLEGAVPGALDALLAVDGVALRGELAFLVVLTLLAAEPIAVTRIRRVVSHPQPLGQARAWLRAHLAPDVELVEAASMAAAARDLEAYGPPESTAALGPAAAARRYGRQIVAWLAPGEGEAPNVTRFVVVARQDAPPTGRDRTSLVFAVTNTPGALVAALTVFAARGINLTRIESRPSKRALGEYMFHVDAEGHRLDPGLAAALAELAQQAAWIKLLGSYPAAPAPGAAA